MSTGVRAGLACPPLFPPLTLAPADSGLPVIQCVYPLAGSSLGCGMGVTLEFWANVKALSCSAADVGSGN